MKQQDWTELLRSRLDFYEEPVPERVWDETMRRSRNKTHRMVLRRWVAGVAASVLLLAGAFLIWQDAGESQPEAGLGSRATMSGRTSERDMSLAADAPPYAVASQSILPRRPRPANLSTSSPMQADTVRLLPDEAAHGAPADSTVPPHALAVEPAASTTSRQCDYQQEVLPPGRHDARRHQRQLTFSLRTSNLLASGGTTTLTPMQMSRSYMGAAGEAFSRQSPMYLVAHDEEAHHRLPVVFGMSVSLPLSNRWWLETGLTYTRQWSTFTHRYAAIVQVDDQHLSYVGLPVAAGYSFWQTPRLSAYATVGMAADWCVSATITSGSIRRDRVQLSASAGVGLQYRLLPSLSVYVQPLLRYYPDNGSALQNIYKEKPTLLDLQLGLRCTVK
ncbi:MAG: hypothetical protein IJV24_08585 [Prevotella sp.]|nr:hypothetical protein [Prevotella sp.]